MKLTRYEFWPTSLFYLPALIYYFFLCARYRQLGLLSIVNPGMIKQSIYQAAKVEILAKLAQSNPQYIAKCVSLSAQSYIHRLKLAQEFIKSNKLSYPIIIKPQIGQRGTDIRIIKSEEQLKTQLKLIPQNTLYMLQEYISGTEYGVHYLRMPKEANGKIFSIGRKDLISLKGDGKTTLQNLILADPRACIMYKTHFSVHKKQLNYIAALDEKVQLVDIGTHSRGAIFIDARKLNTEALERKIDQISKGYKGFYMGRYDIIAASQQEFQQGKNFKVVELNSVMGEPPHIYDPRNSLLQGYKYLMEYCRLIVQVAMQNMRLGVKPLSAAEFIRLSTKSYRQLM